MKKKQIQDIEFERFLYSEINSITDIQLLILKGVILIEYSLEKFISDSAISKVYNTENFTFSRKLKIAKILGLFFENKIDFLESQITNINKLRNQIAHQLTYDSKIIGELIEFYSKDQKFSHLIKSENSHFANFYHIIPAICGEIIGRKLAKQKIKVFTKSILIKLRAADPTKFDEALKNFDPKNPKVTII